MSQIDAHRRRLLCLGRRRALSTLQRGAPPGHYLARGAAQEAMEGKLASAGTDVDIK
jgi:hypothetical protein